MKKILLLITVFSVLLISCEKEDLSTLSDSFYVRHSGADMPVHIYGNATEKIFIILLHGGPGNNALDFRTSESAEKLEEHYAVVYWQQRGQGSSEGKFNSEDVTIDMMAEDLQAVIQVLKYKYGENCSFFLLGHSWGGELGTAFLIKNDYQNQISGWIEVDGAHDIPKINTEAVKMFIAVGNEQINLNNSKDKWQKIVEYAEQIDTTNIDIQTGRDLNRKAHSVEKYLLHDNIIQKPNGKTMRKLGIMYHEDFLTGIISVTYTYINNEIFYNEIETTSFTDKLHQITIPCLFLWGKYDFIVPSQLGVDAYNLVNTDEKELVIFDRSGHFPMENQADEFVAAVSGFVEKHK